MNGTATAQCSCRSDALNLRISAGSWILACAVALVASVGADTLIPRLAGIGVLLVPMPSTARLGPFVNGTELCAAHAQLAACIRLARQASTQPWLGPYKTERPITGGVTGKTSAGTA